MDTNERIKALERRIAELEQKCERLAEEPSAVAESVTDALAAIEDLKQGGRNGSLYELKAAVVEDGLPKIVFSNDHVGDVEIVVVDGVLTMRRAA